MAELFGDIERLAADLYPYRWPIATGIVLAFLAVFAYGHHHGWHLILWERRRLVAVIGIPVLVVVGFMAYDLGSPLFTNTTVDEEFPFAFSAIVPPNMNREQVEEVMAGIAMVDQSIQEAMPPSMAKAPLTELAESTPGVISSLDSPPNQPDLTPPVATEVAPLIPDVSLPVLEATQAPPQSPLGVPTIQPSSTLIAPGPIKIKTGIFRDQDSFHKGSGTATVYLGPDGSYLLRIEDFKVTNGPDLHIFLSPHPNPSKLNELYTFGAVDLGKLKGNIGNQNYVTPVDVDVNAQMSVVIYCVPFSVFFSIASLGSAE